MPPLHQRDYLLSKQPKLLVACRTPIPKLFYLHVGKDNLLFFYLPLWLLWLLLLQYRLHSRRGYNRASPFTFVDSVKTWLSRDWSQFRLLFQSGEVQVKFGFLEQWVTALRFKLALDGLPRLQKLRWLLNHLLGVAFGRLG